MAMAAPATPMRGLTWQDFLDLPDDDRYRHAELVNGELVLNPPTPLHNQIVARLYYAIETWIREGTGRGEVTMEPATQIAEDRGYLPDLAWYRQEKCAPPGQPPEFDGVPDLVAEVLSPSTRRLDLVRKRSDYARIGLRELWFIDPDEPAGLVLRPHKASGPPVFVDVADLGRDDQLTSPLLPGFGVQLGDLLER